MKLSTSAIRNSFFILAVILALTVLPAAAQTTAQSSGAIQAQTPAVPARITQAIDETQLVTLKGNVHPLARPEFDRGPVSNATPMKRMLLLLQRSPEQEAALQQFMNDQLSKGSPNFHNWLTPEQFGKLYGPADVDIQTVTGWLASLGFAGITVNRGKTAIEFSGNVGQVRNAFHTDIHKFMVNAEEQQSNIKDPQIPAALTPVVAGIVSLNNFPLRSMRRLVGQFTRTADGKIEPQFTGSGNPPAFFAVGPADFAKIYNIPSSLDGTGGNIAIIGLSDIAVSDAHSFRALFGLPVNDPVVVNNGPDPGFSGEEGEADLDTQWSGAVAPKAMIHYVLSEQTQTSDPILLGAEYVIDNNSDDVMSLSFGECELNLPAAESAFFNTLWEEAAAQGITVTVSAGDGGTAGCDDFNTASSASGGLAVSAIASTPFNIAVGGTDFDDVGTQITGGFWSATNSTDGKKESALGYIHEVPWNDSCAATATPTNLTTCGAPNNIVAGSGGASVLYAKPAFQGGITPNGRPAGDNHRYLPDVSLFASNGQNSESFYVVCQADALQLGAPPSCASSGPFSFFAVGGTSASAPSFAGIIALIGQSEVNAGRSRRQGNANLVLYKLAQTAANSCNSSTQTLTPPASCIFNDVTKGNNSVPCAGASLNCSNTTAGGNGVLVTVSGATQTPAYTAAAGYDLATGLGTVNVTNLAAAWGTAVTGFKATTTATKINGGTSPVTITHGQSATLAATVTTATGTPTGDVSFLAPTTVNGGIGDQTLSTGTATLATTALPGGSYSVKAHYAGDGTFAPSDDPTGVPVVVNKENSRLQAGIVTFDSLGNIAATNATSFTYGSPYILRFDILNSTTAACQPLTGGVISGCAIDATGTVTVTDNGNPLDQGTFPVNSEGHGEDQPIQLTGGTHTVVANYSGDISYNASGPVTLSLSVAKVATTIGMSANQTTGVTTATPITFTATISSQSNSATGSTGTVTFLNNGTQIGSPVAVIPIGVGAVGAGGTAALTFSFTTPGSESVTASYSGDTNYVASGPSTAVAFTVTQAQVGSFTLGGTAATVTAGASGNSAITLTPTGGFTGAVAISCGTTLPGVTCSALNVTVPSGGANGTGSLAVNVAAPSSATTAMNLPDGQDQWAATKPAKAGALGWWTLSGGTGFAAILFLFLPGRKRYRAALGLGLVCVLSFALGCGGGSGGGGGGGTTATTTHLTVSSTKVAATGTLTVSATVSGGTPTGNVQFFVDGAAAGNAVPVTGGSTGNIMLTAASAPPLFQLIGTHTLSAHYLGDATTTASSSGTLNLAVTGTTQLAISANPASSNANVTISLTIN